MVRHRISNWICTMADRSIPKSKANSSFEWFTWNLFSYNWKKIKRRLFILIRMDTKWLIWAKSMEKKLLFIINILKFIRLFIYFFFSSLDIFMYISTNFIWTPYTIRNLHISLACLSKVLSVTLSCRRCCSIFPPVPRHLNFVRFCYFSFIFVQQLTRRLMSCDKRVVRRLSE